jgi:hypothetical protein
MPDISKLNLDEDDILCIRELINLCFRAKFVTSNQQF